MILHAVRANQPGRKAVEGGLVSSSVLPLPRSCGKCCLAALIELCAHLIWLAGSSIVPGSGASPHSEELLSESSSWAAGPVAGVHRAGRPETSRSSGVRARASDARCLESLQVLSRDGLLWMSLQVEQPASTPAKGSVLLFCGRSRDLPEQSRMCERSRSSGVQGLEWWYVAVIGTQRLGPDMI